MSSSRTITIRHANTTDIAKLGPVEHSAGQAFLSIPALAFLASGPTMLEDDLKVAMSNGCLLVAQQSDGKCTDGEEAVLGFLAAHPLDTGLHIAEVSVVSHEQGKGIGRALVEAACDFARKKRKHVHLSLTTYNDVPWNRRFYSKLGFEVIDAALLGPEHVEKMKFEAAVGLEKQYWTRCCMAMTLSRQEDSSVNDDTRAPETFIQEHDQNPRSVLSVRGSLGAS